MKVSPIRCGLTLGIFLGFWHASWATLVAAGYAQPLVNWILDIHYLQVPVTIAPFDVERAYVLVSATILIGLVAGSVSGLLWNALRGR